MNIEQFWRKAADIYNLYHDRYRRALLTEEEQRKDIASFNSDMDALDSEWFKSREEAER